MKVVERRPTRRIIVTIVPADRRDVGVKFRVEKVKRVTTEQKGEVGAGVVEEVLDRMHGQARPRARIAALMVETVHVPVEERADVTILQAVLHRPPRMHQPVDLKTNV